MRSNGIAGNNGRKTTWSICRNGLRTNSYLKKMETKFEHATVVPALALYKVVSMAPPRVPARGGVESARMIRNDEPDFHKATPRQRVHGKGTPGLHIIARCGVR